MTDQGPFARAVPRCFTVSGTPDPRYGTAGRDPAIWIGGEWRFERAAIVQWLETPAHWAEGVRLRKSRAALQTPPGPVLPRDSERNYTP